MHPACYAIICCCFVGFETIKATEAPIERPDKFNTFDWALTKAIGAKSEENVVLSPVSVKLVLAMLYEGSRGNTSRQLEKALDIMPLVRSFTAEKFSSILQSLEEAHSGYDITIGTKLFIDQEAQIKQQFVKRIDSLYNATIEKINFKNTMEAVSKINAWAKAVTNGHIKHLVSEADTRESTIMLLLNAVYFKGFWEYPFAANETSEGNFYINADTTIKVPFMKAVHTLKYTESSELKASILRMPYMGGKFAMYILLPFEKTGVADLISSINPDKLRELLPTMMAVPVQLTFPKFHFEFASSLAPILQQLGIKDMFNSNANLTGIAEGPKELVVSNVIQKAGINVNEQGSTAYATTVVDLTSKFGEYTVEFNANHPFLFFIEDETTDTIVFVGKVIDPTAIGKPKVHATEPPEVYTKVENTLESEVPNQQSLINPQTFSYFDIELAQNLNSNERANWVTSPSSIKTVLSLVLEGADGNTLHQLIQLLRLPDDKIQATNKLRAFQSELKKDSQGAKVKSINKILIQKDLELKPEYKDIITNGYGVDIEKISQVSPSITAKRVNSWVNGVTEGLIPELLDPGLLNANTSLIFLNAIYFKGEWKVKFDPAATHLSCFYTDLNDCKKTYFMKARGYFKYGYIPSLSAKIIELPYSDPTYSMVILLPAERNGLQRTIRNLPFNSVYSILETLQFSEVALTLPKFTIEYSLDLVPILQKLGAEDLFTDKANLGDMLASNKKTSISGVIHKAKIIVNELGTEASAATAALAETLMSRQGINFVADHPFLFFIKNVNTGFLFEGAYVNPASSNEEVDRGNAASPLSSRAPESGSQNEPNTRPVIRNTIQNIRF